MSLAPRSQQASSNASVIENVPAHKWAEKSCAAGALSEVLNHFGQPVSEQQLSTELTRVRSGGVVTVDLLIAARKYGFDAQLLRGTMELVQRELEQRHPLILMIRVLDAPGTRDDLFHYVVLSGIDKERGLVCMHYGDARKRWVPLQPLQPAWAAGGYATFLIGPRKKHLASDEDLRRAVLLEDAGEATQAIPLYRDYLNAHPESALAWTNLGNAYASSGEKQQAEAAYHNALFVDKENRDALNNLACLLLANGRLDEAENLARRAAAQDVADRYLALDTLARVLSARAECRAAISTFGEAVRLSSGEARANIEQALAATQRECGGS